MPNNWKTYKLGELGDIKGGKRLPKGEALVTTKTKHPYIRVTDMGTRTIPIEKLQYVPNDVFPKISRYIVNTNDLILSIVGTVGSISIIDKKLDNASLTENCVKITNMKNIDSEYLYYYLISDIGQFEIVKGIVGSTQPKLPIYNINNLDIILPSSIQEQKSIASILSAIDDKIENNLAINKTLEEMAMALYKHWFVDFGPFQDGEFVESELGSIPKGWEVKRLDEIAFKRAETYKFKGKEKVVFVNTGDVLEGSFMHKNYMDVEDLPGQAKKAIYPEDILYSEIRPGNKRYAYVDFDSQDYVVSTKFMVIRNNELINNKLLYRILTRDETIAEFQNIAESRSGTFPQITFDAIGHIKFALPNIDKQNEFQSIVGNWEEQQANNLKENQTLTQLRDTLLPKLISGEVRLKEFRE